MSSRDPAATRRSVAKALNGENASAWGQMARALASGQPVTSEDGPALGRSRQLVSVAISDLRMAGWTIPPPEGGEFRATTDPEGRPIRPQPRSWQPGPPLKRAGGRKPRTAPPAKPSQGIRHGRLKDVAAVLTGAYPAPVDLTPLGTFKQVSQCVYWLRNRHGWDVAAERHGQYRLVQTPDGVPDSSAPVQPSTAVEPHPDSSSARYAAKQRAGREELEELKAFHRAAPATPVLGQVFRTTMIAEDDGHAVVVLTDRAGARWYLRVEGTDAGVTR